MCRNIGGMAANSELLARSAADPTGIDERPGGDAEPFVSETRAGIGPIGGGGPSHPG
jgi:hypothetical protein